MADKEYIKNKMDSPRALALRKKSEKMQMQILRRQIAFETNRV